jgi:VanZ family protein
VRWLGNKNGLEFASNSSVLSAAAFHSKSSRASRLESIEIWLVPASSSSAGTILGFGESDHPGAGFALRQHKNMLFVRQYYVDKSGAAGAKWLPVGDVVAEGRPLFISATMSDLGTSIYINGALSRTYARLGESKNNLTGRLVVADGAEGRSSWPGRMLGLGMYASELTPSQVGEHYANWTRGQPPVIREDEAPTALFAFDERYGHVAHNRVDPTTNLVIPDRYFVMHPPFLASVARDYQPTREYWHDIIINVAGFIPCGFLFAVFLSEIRIVKYPAWTAISIGLLISLTIEVLQAFLPTRSSGATDLITNTLGTGAGVTIYYWRPAQSVLARIRQWFGIRVSPAVSGSHPGFGETSVVLIASAEEQASISA